MPSPYPYNFQRPNFSASSETISPFGLTVSAMRRAETDSFNLTIEAGLFEGRKELVFGDDNFICYKANLFGDSSNTALRSTETLLRWCQYNLKGRRLSPCAPEDVLRIFGDVENSFECGGLLGTEEEIVLWPLDVTKPSVSMLFKKNNSGRRVDPLTFSIQSYDLWSPEEIPEWTCLLFRIY